MDLPTDRRAIDINNGRVLDSPEPGEFVKPQDNGLPSEQERLVNICVEQTVDVNYQEKTVVQTRRCTESRSRVSCL
jgi:hypothetical protein